MAMDFIEWNEMNKILDEKNAEIFSQSIPSDNYEKRKMIFNNLVDNNEYDFDLLKEIVNAIDVRQGASVIIDPLKNGKGVCNGISYVYKMLLEKVGINSMIIYSELKYNQDEIEVIVNQGINLNKVKRDDNGNYLLGHMLTLIENDDGTFSFDDPTCAILDRENRDTYIDYDLNMAEKHHQINFKGMPTDFLEIYVGREQTEKDKQMVKKYQTDSVFLSLPIQIKKYKDNIKIDDMER